MSVPIEDKTTRYAYDESGKFIGDGGISPLDQNNVLKPKLEIPEKLPGLSVENLLSQINSTSSPEKIEYIEREPIVIPEEIQQKRSRMGSRIFNNSGTKTNFTDYQQAIDDFDLGVAGKHMSQQEAQQWAKDHNLNLTNAQLRTIRRGYNETNGGAFSRFFNKGAQAFTDNIMSNYLNKKVNRKEYYTLDGKRVREGDEGYQEGNGFNSMEGRNKAITDYYSNADNWQYDPQTGKYQVKAFSLGPDGKLTQTGSLWQFTNKDDFTKLGLDGSIWDNNAIGAEGKSYWDTANKLGNTYTHDTLDWSNADAIASRLLTPEQIKEKTTNPMQYNANLKNAVKNYMEQNLDEFSSMQFAKMIRDNNLGFTLDMSASHPAMRFAKYANQDQIKNFGLPIRSNYTYHKNGGNITYFYQEGSVIKAQAGAELNYGVMDFIPGVDIYRQQQRINALKNDTSLSDAERAEALRKARWEQTGNVVGNLLMFTPAGWLAKGVKTTAGGRKLWKAGKTLKSAEKALATSRKVDPAKLKNAKTILNNPATSTAQRRAATKVVNQSEKWSKANKAAKTARAEYNAATPAIAKWTANNPMMTKLAGFGASKGTGFLIGNSAPAVTYGEQSNDNYAGPLPVTSNPQPNTSTGTAPAESINSNYSWYNKQGGKMHTTKYFQAGGTMTTQTTQPTKENDIEQQVVQLVQAAMQGDQQATQTIDQIMQAAQSGDQQAVQIAQMIQEVAKQMQGQAQAAKYGAKVAYLRKLKTGVNADEEVIYQKCGGKTVKKVVKKDCKGAKMKKGC